MSIKTENPAAILKALKALENLVLQGEIAIWEAIENGEHTVDVSVTAVQQGRAALNAARGRK